MTTMTTQHTHQAADVALQKLTPDDLLNAETIVQAINTVMLRSTDSSVPVLRDASRHIIESGGKRIRPRLLLLAYAALGGRDMEYVLPVAASVELVHTASVIHDDINDHGMMRRGRASVNAIWGRTMALLAGDFLFTKVYELMAPYDSHLNATFAESTVALVEGETLQASAVKENLLTREVYLRVIGLKTAELFRAATKLGAELAEADERTAEAMGDFGYNIGMAFQMWDDILDLTADSTQLGKTAGLDVAQGKGLASVAEADDNDPMQRIKAAVLRGGDAIEKGRQLAHGYVQQGLDALNVLPDSPIKAALTELAWTTVDRRS